MAKPAAIRDAPPVTGAQLKSLVGRLLRETFPPNKHLFIISFGVALGLAGTTAGLALVIRVLVDDVFISNDRASVALVTFAIIVLSITRAAMEYLMSTTSAKIRRTLLSGFQLRLFRKLLAFRLGYFDGRHAGEHTAEIMFFAGGSTATVLAITNNLLRDIVTFAALCAVMIWQEPLMSLIVALAVPPFAITMRVISRRVRALAVEQVRLNGKLPARINETLQGLRIIRSFGLEEQSDKEVTDLVRELENRSLEINRISATLGPVTEVVGGLVVALLVSYASWQSAVYDRSPGELIAFIVAFMFARGPARRLAGFYIRIQKQMIAVEKMYEILDSEDDLDDSDPTRSVDPITKGLIEFDTVALSYDGNRPALDGLSLRVEPGETVALVGRSGSGKSTIINALVGFVDIDSGVIRVDGRDISGISKQTLYDAVALVSQDVFLFDGTLRDNISDGDHSASADQIAEAARRADLDGALAQMEIGLDTRIGPNGANLSGGQRQRVSIARAILKNAPIIIYDEATSSIDGESEKSILANNIKNKDPSQTVLCVAHRRSTIEAADRVIVIDEGRVVDQGTPEEMAASNEIYRTIFHVR